MHAFSLHPHRQSRVFCQELKHSALLLVLSKPGFPKSACFPVVVRCFQALFHIERKLPSDKTVNSALYSALKLERNWINKDILPAEELNGWQCFDLMKSKALSSSSFSTYSRSKLLFPASGLLIYPAILCISASLPKVGTIG